MQICNPDKRPDLPGNYLSKLLLTSGFCKDLFLSIWISSNCEVLKGSRSSNPVQIIEMLRFGAVFYRSLIHGKIDIAPIVLTSRQCCLERGQMYAACVLSGRVKNKIKATQNPEIETSIDRSIDWSNNQSIDQLTVRSIDQTIDRKIKCLQGPQSSTIFESLLVLQIYC